MKHYLSETNNRRGGIKIGVMNKKTSTPRRLRSNSPEIQFIEEIRKVPLAKR
jgi:hypothetical protein